MKNIGNIREYVTADLGSTARVWLLSGQAEYDYLPAFQDLDEQKSLAVFRRHIQDKCKLWVYEAGDAIVGFIAMDGSFIDRLYVTPDKQGVGIGSELLDHAKQMYPNGLSLRTHQRNTRARAFYKARGFKSVSYGLSPPPELMPDVEYHWSGVSRYQVVK